MVGPLYRRSLLLADLLIPVEVAVANYSKPLNGSSVRPRGRGFGSSPLEASEKTFSALRGIWAESGGGTKELLEERRRERDAEERKAQRWGVDRPR